MPFGSSGRWSGQLRVRRRHCTAPAGQGKPILQAAVLRRRFEAMDMPTRLRPTEGQLALAALVARGESSHGEAITTVPASAYTDPANFELEQSKLFHRLPQ